MVVCATSLCHQILVLKKSKASAFCHSSTKKKAAMRARHVEAANKPGI
jgi:hypothetical protein